MLSRKIAQFNGMTAARQGGENAYSRFKMEIFHENGRFHGENGRFLDNFPAVQSFARAAGKMYRFRFWRRSGKIGLDFYISGDIIASKV